MEAVSATVFHGWSLLMVFVLTLWLSEAAQVLHSAREHLPKLISQLQFIFSTLVPWMKRKNALPLFFSGS